MGILGRCVFALSAALLLCATAPACLSGADPHAVGTSESPASTRTSPAQTHGYRSTMTTSSTTPSTTVVTAPPQASDLLHLWWDWSKDWTDLQTENVSEIVGARIVGEPYSHFDMPDFPVDQVIATGESGDLSIFSTTAEAWEWEVTSLASPSGLPLQPLCGGRAFNDPLVATQHDGVKTIHILVTDKGDDLIHFWSDSGPDETWHSENVSAATGAKVARMGSTAAGENGATVRVAATDPQGDLLSFRLAPGGRWEVENLSTLVSEAIKEEASFYRDGAHADGVTIVAPSPEDHLLMFHLNGEGRWTVEDVTAATATGTAGGVELGGWLSWWEWDREDYWDGSQFRNPLAVLDPEGHFWLLERASASDPWSATDVSSLIGVTFRADSGGDSILRFHNPPNIPREEIHFAGVDRDRAFIHFWRDGEGTWLAEDLTARTGRKAAHPVNHYLSTWVDGQGRLTAAYDYVCAIDPDSHLLFYWDNAAQRDWRVFDATLAAGCLVRPPELPWGYGSGESHLVIPGAD